MTPDVDAPYLEVTLEDWDATWGRLPAYDRYGRPDSSATKAGLSEIYDPDRRAWLIVAPTEEMRELQRAIRELE